MAKNDDLEKQLKLIQEANKSMEAYTALLVSIKEFQDQINYVKGQEIELTKQLKSAEAELIKARASGDKNRIKNAERAVAAYELGLEQAEEALVLAERELQIRKNVVSEISKQNLVVNETLNLSKKLGNEVLKATGYWLEQQKGVKETELSMGVLSNQSKGFRGNIYQTAISTTEIGVNTKELAKLQGTYADNVGRAVQLNEEQLTAVAEIGKGTMLGTEASAELAANFQNVGVGIMGTKDTIEDALALSTKMGVTASKTIKTIQKNLGLVNRYNFQGGVAGFSKMATLAAKFGIEMESIAGLADNLMTPEGAVEVASKLQVLGGEWAKLGDPFELMFRSRNDLGGLTEDIIDATKATARFDESTGEFRIDPMELHRLREVAAVTGLNAEELAKTAKEKARLDKISGQLPSMFNEEDKDYLASIAQYDNKTGKFNISVSTPEGELVKESIGSLRKITPELVEELRSEKKSLEDRAKQSLTFNEKFSNLVDTLKTSFLPAFEVVADLLEGTAEFLAPMVKDVAEFIVEWPKSFATIGAILAGSSLIGDMGMWIARGRALGMGFNSVAGGVGGGGTSGGLGGKLFGKMTKGGGLKGFGGNVGKGLGSIGAIGGGLLSAGFSGYDEYTSNKEAGMDTGENVGRTALRGGSSGLGAWGGAAAGAAIGSAVPVIGTLIGGLIGGALGAWGGDALGDWGGDAIYGEQPKSNTKLNDFVARPGENPISFSSEDTLIGAKKGGPIDKMIDQNRGGEASNGKVSVEFNQPIKIEGKIEVSSGDESKEIDLDDPILMRSLAKMIQEELSKAVGGGKISSNPVPA